MGGDGGTKAVQRAYLRGAGSASTSADRARHNSNGGDPAAIAERIVRALTHCALTDRPLDFKAANGIVACPYGRLYYREAAVEALIRRKRQQADGEDGDAGERGPADDAMLLRHVRGLKDLHAVRFQINESGRPVCAVTSRELTGKGVAAYALLVDPASSSDGSSVVNVVSEYALKELGEDELLKEYGATAKLRLAPPPDQLKQIEREWEEQCAAEKAAKKKNKKKKRKQQHDHLENGHSSRKTKEQKVVDGS